MAKNLLKHYLVVTLSTFELYRQTGNWTSNLFIQNVNNLLDSPVFWLRKIFGIVSKTMRELTGAPVAKCTVSVLSF